MTANRLERVLAANAHLNTEHPDGRAKLASAIVAALPREHMRVVTRATLSYKAATTPRNDNIGAVDTTTNAADAVVEQICTVLGWV